MGKIWVCMLITLGCLAVGAEDAFEDAKWNDTSKDFSASLGVGYKENVLYSEIVPKDSWFSYLDLGGMMRGDLIGMDSNWSVMAVVESKFYSDIPGVSDETFGVALAEFGKGVGLFSEASVGSKYLYFNQAFDATYDLLEERTVVLKAHEPGVFLEWKSLLWEFEYIVEVNASRMYFDSDSSDYETQGLEFEVNYAPTDRSSVAFVVEKANRSYVELLARDRDGLRVSDHTLRYDLLTLELEWKQTLSAGNFEVLAGVEISRSERRDVFEYYDRDRTKFEVSVEISPKGWRKEVDDIERETSMGEVRGSGYLKEGKGWFLRAEFGQSRSKYPVQVTDSDELRASDGLVWSLRFERDLTKKIASFVHLEVDEDKSNESLFSYESNSLMLGFSFY